MAQDSSSDSKYWSEAYAAPPSPAESFYEWSDSKRREYFATQEGGLSLEIGPGRGSFTTQAKVKVVVDLSHAGLVALQQKTPVFAVVADAQRLPFRPGVFDVVYTNDVTHHLKAQGALPACASEIKRVLRVGGFWCVSDRLPKLLNSFLLWIGLLLRKALVFAGSLSGKKLVLCGSDEEPAMEDGDYVVIRDGMEVYREKKWRPSAIVFFLYTIVQFAGLILGEVRTQKLAERFLRWSDWCNAHLGEAHMCDVCLTLRKPAPGRPGQ